MWDSLPYRVKANTQQENRSVSQACGELISRMPSKGVAEERSSWQPNGLTITDGSKPARVVPRHS